MAAPYNNPSTIEGAEMSYINDAGYRISDSWDDGEDYEPLSHAGEVRQTEKAVCFKKSGDISPIDEQTFWLPKSVIAEQDDNSVLVKRWFIEQNGDPS